MLKNFHEALQAHFSHAVPHARECGIVVTLCEEQGVEASMPYRPEFLGDAERGLIHTGVITTLIDTMGGLAALAAIVGIDQIATLDLRMDYLRPATPDKTLHCRAECYRLTRSIAFVRSWAWQDRREEPVAVSQATFMRTPQKARGERGPL